MHAMHVYMEGYCDTKAQILPFTGSLAIYKLKKKKNMTDFWKMIKCNELIYIGT